MLRKALLKQLSTETECHSLSGFCQLILNACHLQDHSNCKFLSGCLLNGNQKSHPHSLQLGVQGGLQHVQRTVCNRIKFACIGLIGLRLRLDYHFFVLLMDLQY